MEKLKWACDQSFERDRAYGFSWPQRNYRCSFCKKEFKSAQALGGHMNVHRRDRARMRLSSPSSWESPPNQNPKPNPKPSFSLSSSSKPKFLPYNVACLSSPFSGVTNVGSLVEENVSDIEHTIRGRDHRGKKKKNGGGLLPELTGFARKNDARVWKGNEFVRLDLNLGLIQTVKEDLDLELRLGYSN
ncbi:hypothetical protein OROGR_019459 [Orobanche gracilis]